MSEKAGKSVFSKAFGYIFSPEGIVCVSVIAAFLHYYITFGVILVYTLYVNIAKSARKSAYSHKSSYIALAFFVISAAVSLIYGNYYPGFVCTLLFYSIIVIGLFLRDRMTRDIYEKALDLCCYAAVPVSLMAVIEKLINLGLPNYRCQVWFANSNYLGAMLASVVIICSYKVITRQHSMFMFYGIAVLCGVAMYLCGSMFVWIEILMGVSVYLTLTRHHVMLGIFLIICMTCCLFVYCVPELIPRLNESNITTDNRVTIWQFAIHSIPEAPVFGKGFFTYGHAVKSAPGQYVTNHAHNILLDSLLSSGIVGTLLITAFLYCYYRSVYICERVLKKSSVSALILAVSAAVLVHSTTDMTMLWCQTGLLYVIILSGVGAEEKIIEERRRRRNSVGGGNKNG